MTIRPSSNRISSAQLRQQLPNYLFIVPQVLAFIFFLVYPVARGIQISLADWKIMAPVQRYVGLTNYAELLRDPTWWSALRNSLLFTGVVMAINTTLALALSVALKPRFWGRDVLRVLVYLPGVLSVTVLGLIMFRVWDPAGGLLNEFIVSVLRRPPVQWWGGTSEIFILAISTVWWTFGLPTLVFIAGLSGIPEPLYEAARIDGANSRQLFTRITLPLLTPTLLFVLSTQFITHMQMFGQAYQAGSDSGASQTVFVLLFNTSWKFFRFGYASAMGVAVTVVIILVTRLLFALFSRRFEY